MRNVFNVFSRRKLNFFQDNDINPIERMYDIRKTCKRKGLCEEFSYFLSYISILRNASKLDEYQMAVEIVLVEEACT